MRKDLVQQKPTCQIVRVTKNLVDALLEMNTKNRNPRKVVIERYRRLIKDGLFVLTNQGIGVTTTGVTFDGQHRLEAIRQEGYPDIEILLVTGLSEDAAAAVDQGANRTAADYLHFLFNQKVSTSIPAILRTIMLMDRPIMNRNLKFDPREYAACLEEYGDSINAVLAVEQSSKIPAACLAAFVLGHAKGVLTDEVISFVRDIAIGDMLKKDSPQFVLRRWLDSTKGSGGPMLLEQRFHKTESALKAFLEGRSMIRVYGKKAFRNRVRDQSSALA